jgi:hypothetical protein
MRKALRIRWLGWLFPAALLLASCGSPAPNFGQRVDLEGPPSRAYSLAGPVAGSPALLALVTNKHSLVTAYACDGQQMAEWFVGTVQGQSVDLTNPDGSHLQATLTAQDAQGTLALHASSPLTFQITLATGPAGLYRAKQEVNGTVYLAGWVLLPNGRQAGVIENDAQKKFPAPPLDPAHPSIPLPGGGTLTPQLVTPESDL